MYNPNGKRACALVIEVVDGRRSMDKVGHRDTTNFAVTLLMA